MAIFSCSSSNWTLSSTYINFITAAVYAIYSWLWQRMPRILRILEHNGKRSASLYAFRLSYYGATIELPPPSSWHLTLVNRPETYYISCCTFSTETYSLTLQCSNWLKKLGCRSSKNIILTQGCVFCGYNVCFGMLKTFSSQKGIFLFLRRDGWTVCEQSLGRS